jgi:curli biogenesis system outer membrane secretion channel CsgG
MKHIRAYTILRISILLVSISWFLVGCATTKSFVKNSSRIGSINTIVVLPFMCSRPDIGYTIADSLSGYLVQTRFNVIERVKLIKILEGQGLTMAEVMIDSSLLIGSIKGIDAVIIGSATTSYGFAGLIHGGNVSYVSDCSSRMVDVETGEILIGATFTASSPSTDKGVPRATKVGIWLGMEYSKY